MRHPRPAGDDGAVAVLVSLVVVSVLLPVSALGLSTYVRGTALNELQQAADTAALAGAASIPLTDVDYVGEYARAASGVDVPDVTGFVPGSFPSPLAVACTQARLAAAENDAVSAAYASPPSGPARSCQGRGTAAGEARPDAAGFAASRYLTDSEFFTRTGECLTRVDAALDATLGPVRDQLPSVLPVPTTTDEVAAAADLVVRLNRLLPLLLHPGVEVELTHGVRGPFDQLLGRRGASEQRVEARAVRRIKNVVVLPVLTVRGRTISVARPVDNTLDSAVRRLDAADERLEQLQTVSGGATTRINRLLQRVPGDDDPQVATDALIPALRACTDVFDQLRGDYEDAVAPDDNVRDQDEILLEAACAPGSDCRENGGRPQSVVALLTTGERASFYDAVEVCFDERSLLAGTSVDGGAEVGTQVDVSVDSQNASIEVGAEAQVDFQVRTDAGDRVLRGVRCATRSPGSFRATLVR